MTTEQQHLGAAELFRAAAGLSPSQTLQVIQTLGPSFSIGAFQGVDPASLIVLGANNSVAARYMTFHQTLDSAGNGTSGTDYQVPAGQQLIIGAVVFSCGAAAASVVIGYGDDGVARNNVAAPTNGVALNSIETLMAAVITTMYNVTVAFKVPATKYPYLYNNAANTGCYIVGILRNP